MPDFAPMARFVAPHVENGEGDSQRAMELVRPLLAQASVLLFS